MPVIPVKRVVLVLAVGAVVGVGFAIGQANGAATTSAATCSASSYTNGQLAISCQVPRTTTTVTAPAATVTRTVTVAPTATTPVPTKTATPTTTPTSSTSTTPTPTGTTTAPPAGFPNTTNTGVPAGVTLRTVANGNSGTCWNVANSTFYVTCTTTLDAFNIPFVLKVMANNVTVTRSKITAASYYTINTCDCPTYYSGLTLTDDDVNGGSDASSQSIAVMGNANATYTRVNFHGLASSGPRLATGDVLQDSWIHDFVCQTPDHSAGSTANDGGSNITIRHNTIDINTGAAGCASTAIGIDQDFGKYNNVLITGNHVDGGAYCMYVAQKVPDNQYGQSTNIHVEGNTFGRKYYPNCGQYGPVAEVAAGNGNTFTGNVWDDGSPVTP